MSKVEEGSLFVNRFSRVALALSAVTSSFVFADFNLTTVTTPNLDEAIVATSPGFTDGSDVTNVPNVLGALVVGDYSENVGESTTTRNFISGNDTTGTITGIDINNTLGNITSAANVSINALTMSSLVTDSALGTTAYPDINHTGISAVGINVNEAVTGQIASSGIIGVTSTLNNDTNNSIANATGIKVTSTVAKGIVNTGSVSATARTHDFETATDAEGNPTHTNRVVATIGGKTGTSGTLKTEDLKTPTRYTSGLLADATIGKDSKLVQSESATYNDRLVSEHDRGTFGNNEIDSNEVYHDENFMRTDNGVESNTNVHVSTYTPSSRTEPDLDNVISAEGIQVDAEVTGGIANHGYISSLKTDAALTGSSDGSEVGLTITPNGGALAGANTDGINTDATVPAEAEATTPDAVSGGGASGNIGGATYARPNADNGTLPADSDYRDTALAAAQSSIDQRYKDLGAKPTTKAEQEDYDRRKADIDADIDMDAIKADIEKAYQVSPDVDAEIARQKADAAQDAPATATPGDAPTDGFVDGVHTARIGNTVLNANTTGGTAQGVLVRATSATNISNEINATTGALSASNGIDGNRNTNANVTSGTVSAYLGEGTDANGNSRVVTSDASHRLSNDLIGGLENNANIEGAAGAAGITLRTDATAVADRAEGITVQQHSSTDENGTVTHHDIVSNPTSTVAVGTLLNTSTIKGGTGGAGLEILANSTGGVSAADSNISGQELVVSPTAITNVREVVNHGDIVGGMGANAIDGQSIARAGLKATDINVTAGNSEQTTGVTVTAHSDASMGNFFSSGTVKQSLGTDAMKMEADGFAGLAGSTITDSIVKVKSTAIGGIRRVKGKGGDKTKLTDGNLLNAGEISVSLAANAVNMHAEGKASLVDKDEADGTAKLVNSSVHVENETISGVEGSFANIAGVDTDKDTLTKSAAKRGSIKASLAADAVHLTSTGSANLQPLSIEGGSTTVKNSTTSGVGKDFANYGEVSVSLAANGVNLSSESTTTLGKADTTAITAGTTTVVSHSVSGVRGSFVNGASAVETGTLNHSTVKVHNPVADYTNDNEVNPTLVKEHDGYYTIAAQVNENNSSDTNSSAAHLNNSDNLVADGKSSDAFLNQLEDATVYHYDKEAEITDGVIKASLAADAVKFESTSTGDLKVASIKASTFERIDEDDDSHHDVLDTKAVVSSTSISDSSVGKDFINNGAITVSLAGDGVNGKSTATGTLGSGTDVVEGSSVSQYTASISGVKENFLNEAVSREVGDVTAFTVQNGSKEIGAFAYGRKTNQGKVKITASLAGDAIQLESHATNKLDIASSDAAKFIADDIGSGTVNGELVRKISLWNVRAGTTRSDLNSTTTSVSGIGKNFSNTGKISVSLAKNGLNALATGDNTLGSAASRFSGSNIVASMSSVAGVRENFTNDVQSLQNGSLTLVQKDVYDINGSNARLDPKYFINEDAKEGQRVKSNVVDRVVYGRELAKGEISASLAADAIQLDATGTNSILAGTIGTTAVEIVTNHTGYSDPAIASTRFGENNITRVDNNNTSTNVAAILDSDRVIKVTSEDVKSTTVVSAGVGGKFTNKNKISVSLAKNAVTAIATGTTTLGTSATTVIEGGNVLAESLIIAGIGNNADASEHGFLNAAGTYDEGDVKQGRSKVIAHNNGKEHLILDKDSNAKIDDNVSVVANRSLDLVDSEEVIFWDKQDPIVAEMTAALAKDVVNVDAINDGKVIAGTITSVTGDVNVTGESSLVAVVGHHVVGTAKTEVEAKSTVVAGVNGGFTNQGKMTTSLAGHVLSAEGTGHGVLGDASSTIKGSIVKQTTLTTSGVRGDFRNEVLSFDKDNGTVYTELEGNLETPTVAFDKVTTDGKVELSTALAKTVAYLESHAVNEVTPLLAVSSDAVKFRTTESEDWKINTILDDAKSATSELTGKTETAAGISGDFYNTGKISVSLAKEAIDGLADATNTLGSSTTEIKGSNVEASVKSIAGIRGNFNNDVVTLDDGAKYLVKKDVVDVNGNPVYDSNTSHSTVADRIKSNVIVSNIDDATHEDEVNSAFGVNKDALVADGVVYGQKIVEGEIVASLAGDALLLNAMGTNNLQPKSIIENEVRVVQLRNEGENPSNAGIASVSDRNITVDVSSDAIAKTTVIAGIGGSFSNSSSKGISTSLAKNAITATAEGTTNLGLATETAIHGGTTTATTTVIAGIGNAYLYDENASKGLSNLTDSYNEVIHTGNKTTLASNNVAGHALNAATANNASDENSTSLPLIDSEEVVYWDNEIKVGTITTSLAKDAFNLEATSTGTLTAKEILAVTNDVNISDELQSVRGYHVAGSSVGANVSQTTTVYGGVNGDVLNQGEISTSLAGNVINAKGTAEGTVGDTTIAVEGSTVTGRTTVYAGIQNGNFTNEVQSLDTAGSAVVTRVDADGVEHASVIFNRETTKDAVKLEASLAKDVLLLDVSSKNDVDAATIKGSEYVQSTEGETTLNAAKAGMADVSGTTVSIGGIAGNFYNTGMMEASLSSNVITSNATSDNNVGAGAMILQGSKLTAISNSNAAIRGSFTNDAKLFDNDTTPTVTLKTVSETNTTATNVADYVVYDQQLVSGTIKSTTSKDVLSLIATGTNDVKLAEVGNREVKVVSIALNDLNADANHTISAEHNISSNVVVSNTATSGINGKFVNAGTLETNAGTDVLNLQAVGGSSNVKIDKITGGDVTVTNAVYSGIFRDGNATAGIGFLNDKRDFNTLLATDTTTTTEDGVVGYSTDKVAVGTIKADAAQTLVNMVADGGATTDVTANSAHIETTDDTGAYDTATVTNNGTNIVVINGDFVNKGDMTTGAAGVVLNMNATNTATNDVHAINGKGLLSSILDTKSYSFISGDIKNTGTMSTGAAAEVISMVATGGTSAVLGSMSDANLTEWAGANGKVAVKNSSDTQATAANLRNEGSMTTGDASSVIKLSASGIADSSAFTANSDVNKTATNAVIVNNLTANASLDSVYNSGTIKTGGAASAIEATATGGAITAIADSATDLVKSYEDTKATVTVSLGNITNDAFTVQNVLKDVNKAFNTDNNASTDDQLRPDKATVIANRGAYDLTTGEKFEDIDTALYSTEAELNALAYAENNSSKAPILSQTVGTIKSDGAEAIKLSATVDATNTDDESTVVSATVGNITNRGIIGTGTTTVGIDLSSDNLSELDALAKTVAGIISNEVTDNSFTNDAGDVLHAVIKGEIEGTTHGIKLAANIGGAAVASAADQNRSVVTVAQIVNNRLILDKGTEVVDGDITNARNNSAVTTQAENYSTTTLTEDTVYSAVIKGPVAIEVGANVEVTNGIHNYGTIDGAVKLGSADLHLYGIVQNEDKNETYGKRLDVDGVESANYFATTGPDVNGTASAAYISEVSTAFTQEAGTVTGGVSDALVGSSINFHNSHIIEADAAEFKADSINIHKDAIVNIGKDTTFITDASGVENPFDAERTNTVVNEGILNVRAGTKLSITGNYRSVNSGFDTTGVSDGSAKSFQGSFVTNVIASGVKLDNNTTFADAAFGQLVVTGNADLAGGIGVRLDDTSVNLLADTTTETRLVDVIKAGTLSIGDANATHAGGNTQTDIGVKVTDNVSSFDFQSVEGTTAGDVDLIVVAQAVKSAEEGGLVIDTPRVAIETVRNFSSIIDSRIDMSSGYVGKLEGNSGAPVVYINGSGRKTEGRGRVGVEGNDEKGENAGANANVQPSIFAETNYWIKPFVGISEQDKIGDISGYDTNTYGLAAGADKQSGEWFVGLAAALAKSNASSTSGPSSSTETKMFQGTLYGSRKAGEGIVNLQAGAGFLANDRTRLAEAEGSNVEADYNGYVVQAKATYEQAAVVNNDTLLIPYVSAELAHVENAGYTETGAAGAIQSVGSTSADAAILSLGTKAKYKLTDSSSIVGTVGVGYDFLAEEQDYSTTYLASGQSAVLHGAKPEKFEYDLGLAYQVETGAGTQVKLGVDYKGRNGYDSTVGSARFYFPF